MAASETESDTTMADSLENGTTNSKDRTLEKDSTGANASDTKKDLPDDDAIADPDVVDWDGPNDPANPRNWSQVRKTVDITLISLSVLYCNLATTMFAPGANVMAAEFGVTSETIIVMTVTIANIGFAVGPLFVAPLSEVYGRVPIYRTSAVFYLAFTVGCARSTHIGEYLVFRLLTGCAAASYMSCGGGTIADLLPKQERGAAVAAFTAAPLIGPVRRHTSAVPRRRAC